ncbi:PKD_channel domain-containing protein [Haematococcus lacustris]|uniref:PKD_channel domain-containing protein n=1 Tax=Haematococcus lacustris TaxID=44745 RepID=A0A699ZCQ0_HAELA|nr:PKD_channel domain-containing protein [Haematococcus lacustris]
MLATGISILLRKLLRGPAPGADAGLATAPWQGYLVGRDGLLLSDLPGTSLDTSPARYIGSGSANKVLGGLMLHLVRKPLTSLPNAANNTHADNECHASRYTKRLTAACQGAVTLTALQDLGGFGSDAVFNPRSLLFNPALNISDWYNTSVGSPDISGLGEPFGFFHHPLPSLPDGYPVLVDTASSMQRSAELLAMLQDGGFLDKQLTQSLTAQMVSFNPAAAVFGYWTCVLDWRPDGSILATHSVVPDDIGNEDPEDAASAS